MELDIWKDIPFVEYAIPSDDGWRVVLHAELVGGARIVGHSVQDHVGSYRATISDNGATSRCWQKRFPSRQLRAISGEELFDLDADIGAWVRERSIQVSGSVATSRAAENLVLRYLRAVWMICGLVGP